MDKTDMTILVLKILLSHLDGCESRTDFERALKATATEFVERVPIHAKKQK